MYVHVSEIPVYMLCECMFQPTVAVSVSRQTMPVDGASTTKCAVVLQIAAPMKQTGFRLVCGMMLSVACASIIATFFALHAQLNGSNTTYLDVCPLLEPSSSTPSGDYVQPVNIARDIELQTQNLPAPVSLNLVFASTVCMSYVPHPC